MAIYNGMLEFQMTDEEMARFYQDKNKGNEFGLLENQYLIIKNMDGDIVDKYKWKSSTLKDISYKKIKTQMLGEIKPKNVKQQCYFDLLNDNEIKVKVVVGKAGTGKSFIATNWAVEKLMDSTFDRLIVLRNNIQTRGVREIGFRRGDTDEKLSGFLSFMKDIITPENFEQLKFEERLESPYLGEIRGRNFSKCIVYCSEIQDSDQQLIKTIISRIGQNSVLLLDGDMNQCDSVHFEGELNGINAICRSLGGNSLFGVVELDKCERSDVAALADLIE